MPNEVINLDVQSSSGLLADTEKRTIRGLLVPLNVVADNGFSQFRFEPNSVEFGERTPLVFPHEDLMGIGKLTGSQWSDRGLEVTLSVSNTERGTEALQLAADGVLGMSLGFKIAEAKTSKGVKVISRSRAHHIALTPTPAFQGAVVESVSLSKGNTMPDVPEDTTPIPAVVSLSDLAAIFSAALQTPPPTPITVVDGPTPVPVANVASVKEPAPYRFDGNAAEHLLVADLMSSEPEGKIRAAKFLSETFALADVTTGDVPPYVMPTHRPDLSPGMSQTALPRPLASMISTGTITNNTPFTVPKFKSFTNSIVEHTESTADPVPGVGYEAENSTPVQPKLLLGRARISLEASDAVSPALDAIVWSAMVADLQEQREIRIAALLDSLTLTPVDITGVNAALVDDIEGYQIGLSFERGGYRLTQFATNAALFTALAAARDGDGRRLLSLSGASVNSDGTVSGNWSGLSVGSTTARPAWALEDSSYVFNPGVVWQLTSPPRRFDLQIEAGHVNIALASYEVSFVTLESDVRRVDYSAT